ncbi:MAG: methyltransferase domain-containing protein [Planctomycetes bacterium]|nr:methyltransferase domain-containing protein [Planctomycetota bacterium]
MERLRSKYSDPRLVARYDLRYADFAGRRSNARVLRAVRRALEPLPSGARVLDLPCGTGRLFELLATAGWRPCGVDRSVDMLRAIPATARRARDRAIPLAAADVLALPFRGKCFDAAVCLRFLQLLEPAERVEVLRALARVTRGPLVAVYSPHHTWKDVTRALRRWLGVRKKKKEREAWIPWREIEAEIAAAGLVCTRRIHACRGLVDAVALRLEAPPAR